MRFLPKYLEVLGAGALTLGLFDALKTLLGALYAYPGGILSDRWGPRRAFLIFNLISIAGYSVVLVFPTVPAVLGGMFLFLAWSTLSLPATFSMVATNLAAGQHAMGIGMQSLVRRLPVVIGPILGGVLIDRFGVLQGVRIGVAATIVLGAITILIQRHSREAPATAMPALRRNFLEIVRGFDPRLSRLLLSDILVRFCERIPYVWVIVYVLDDIGVSATKAGILIGVEVLTSIAFYIPAARHADRYGKEPFVIATFIFFTLFPLALLAAHSFPMLVFAFFIRGLKEFGEPARKALIISYSPPPARGQTIGAYYLIRDAVVTTGALLGAALWKQGPSVNFATAAALGGLGTIAYVLTRRSEPQVSAER